MYGGACGAGGPKQQVHGYLAAQAAAARVAAAPLAAQAAVSARSKMLVSGGAFGDDGEDLNAELDDDPNAEMGGELRAADSGRLPGGRRLGRAARPGGSRLQSVLVDVLHSVYWRTTVTLVVCVSLACAYCQAAQLWLTDERWDDVNTVLLLFFFLEIFVRIAAYGRDFFCAHRCKKRSQSTCEDIVWNYFDSIIVISGLLYENLRGTKGTMSDFVFFMRTIRLLRILRAAFRILKVCPELYCMMLGLVKSMQSVIWVAAMFATFLLASAIFLTQFVGHHPREFSEPDKIYEAFGTVKSSMRTLFIMLTNDDWSTIARIVNQRYPWMELFWMLHLFLCSFTLLSLLTGLMADEMAKATDTHREEGRRLQEKELKVFRGKMQRRFDSHDFNGDHKIDINEFKQMLMDPVTQADLKRCGIDELLPEVAEELFIVLFKVEQGGVGWDQLFEGLAQLTQGSGKFEREQEKASARHMMLLEGQMLKLDRSLRTHGTETEKVDVLHARTALVRERVNKLAENVKMSIELTEYEPPKCWGIDAE